MKVLLAAIGLGVVACTAPPATMAAPLPQYRAIYRPIDETGSGDASVSLSYDSAVEEYTFIVKRFDTFDHELVTTLQFNLVDDKVRPFAYRDENRACATCTEALRFDWVDRRVEYKTRGSRHVGALTAANEPLRRIVNDIAMLVATLPGRRQLEGFEDFLSIKPLGAVELATALGPVHAEGHALHGTTRSVVWLARELEDLPVRTLGFLGRSALALELAQLDGIGPIAERSGTTAAAAPDAIGGAFASRRAPAVLPEYRAVYRVDYGRAIGAARVEAAVSHDAVADRYELAIKRTEVKHPEREFVARMPFRFVDDRVQPLGIHFTEGSRAEMWDVEFDWTLHEVAIRSEQLQGRYPFVTFDDREHEELLSGIIEFFATWSWFLPGSPEIVEFDGVLAVESLGMVEISVPFGSFSVERLRVQRPSISSRFDVWRSAEIAGLPVRLLGVVLSIRRTETLELMELEGVVRTAAEERPARTNSSTSR